MNTHPPRDMGIRGLGVPLYGPFRPLNQPCKTTTKAALPAPQATTEIFSASA